MASIGPQLPPHLQKRKRASEDEAEVGSPPAKSSRRENEDEIPLEEDDSDDDFGPAAAPRSESNRDRVMGPSLPPTAGNSITPAPGTQKPSIGPSLPPSTKPTNDDEIPLTSDGEEDGTAGPAPPTNPAPSPPAPKRVLGPAPPPADISERPTTGPNSDSSSSSDDDDDGWGPALPTAAPAGTRNLNPTTITTTTSFPPESQQEPSAPKRDDWMLAPPSSTGAYRAPDPTKLKARKFASGPRAATTADGKPGGRGGGGGMGSLWTETPEQKARRLANAVLGREDPSTAGSQQPSQRPSRPEKPGDGSGSDSTRADEARIKSYTEQTRGRSLVEEHQAARLAGKATGKGGSSSSSSGKGKGDDEEDDPSKRAFDWEKDMKVGGRISNSQRRDLLNRAANFGNRFQTGRYL